MLPAVVGVVTNNSLRAVFEKTFGYHKAWGKSCW